MKLLKVAATLAAAFGLFATSMANATVIRVDTDGAGGNAAVAIRNFVLTPLTDSIIHLDLGADLTFNSGDTFTETVNYLVTGFKNPVGGLITPAGTTNFTVQAVLSGFVTGVSGPVASGATIGNILNDTFGITFNPGSSFVFSNTTAGGPVATAVVTSGGSTNFTFQNSTPTLQFGINALFTSIDGNYFMDSSGTSLSTYLPLLFGVADASANLNGVAFADESGRFVDVTVSDNGDNASIVIPEPASIALVGIALLGFGVSSRRFKAKKNA